MRVVVDFADVLQVVRVLTLAGDPDVLLVDLSVDQNDRDQNVRRYGSAVACRAHIAETRHTETEASPTRPAGRRQRPAVRAPMTPDT